MPAMPAIQATAVAQTGVKMKKIYLFIVLVLIFALAAYSFPLFLRILFPPPMTDYSSSFDFRFCRAIVEAKPELCDELALISYQHSCMVKVLSKKASFEKNVDYCHEIRKYNEYEKLSG